MAFHGECRNCGNYLTGFSGVGSCRYWPREGECRFYVPWFVGPDRHGWFRSLPDEMKAKVERRGHADEAQD